MTTADGHRVPSLGGRRSGGFVTNELLVVIAGLAVVIGLSLPMLVRIREAGRLSVVTGLLWFAGVCAVVSSPYLYLLWKNRRDERSRDRRRPSGDED